MENPGPLEKAKRKRLAPWKGPTLIFFGELIFWKIKIKTGRFRGFLAPSFRNPGILGKVLVNFKIPAPTGWGGFFFPPQKRPQFLGQNRNSF
ncbi:hypothetical protein A7985_25370 [Pseudoalteromonas luteoviolacea]|uniref:Uncharacterized protein n=1 Tax=Pseudoalteromonas luteoviolacea TaxID=43657 RepID=A0A1C0TIQ6_9GAMM|nr:hypothetical protein A7985_25370 [Pseudoalteromonas luteoviolacea]